MKRVYLFLAALVGLGVSVALTGQLQAQTTPPAGGGGGAAPARTDPPRVAAFNVAKLMKEFKKWEYYAVTMENARIDAATDLLRLRNEIAGLQEKLQAEPVTAKRDQLIDVIREKQVAFEKKERTYKDQLDTDASKHLKELFGDVNAAVQGVVEANGYDIVFAYPDATTKEEYESQDYIGMKLRATAATPFYVSKRVDITEVMIATLNSARKPPAAIPPKKKMPDPKEMGVVPSGLVDPTKQPVAPPVGPGGR